MVEPSKNISDSYEIKTKNSLKAANVLLAQSLLEEATSMAYYAMYHKTIALFFHIGLKCENHSAAIILLQELFGIDNEDISFAKTERVDKQYYTEFVVTEDDVKNMIRIANDFIDTLEEFIDSLTEEKRMGFREEFEEVYN